MSIRELVNEYQEIVKDINELTGKKLNVESDIKHKLIDEGSTDCLTINWNMIKRTYKAVYKGV